MWDVLAVGFTIGCFALGLLYTRACDKLAKKRG
ncbi:hypothetical protein ACP_0428 [Acidobacterium capsulatum ATCC 51196]|uniref:Uncharacterized protein n=1 Tax=Acidobacterium capsulatum (strain ATCC 51196 / DSM 11244 / BCRC 80197 / JCM 7670 / NBRC 15755 / NCIMB 13165 / 161) TaxID=240015 RepID=C1FA46_ACIC5|nr:hypothetical protein ACP_0428 [Acidobacterium capsulatum ATCC 51196]